MNYNDYTAFARYERIATGTLQSVLSAVKALQDASGDASHLQGLLVFSHATGRQLDFDLRGSLTEILERLPEEYRENEVAANAPGKSGPGRPSLGVTAKEVTLLPRHWDWLASQPAKASGTIRRLIDEERARERTNPRKRAAALGTILWSLAGNLEGFEEASRRLYRLDLDGLYAIADTWPAGLGAFVREWFANIAAQLETKND